MSVPRVLPRPHSDPAHTYSSIAACVYKRGSVPLASESATLVLSSTDYTDLPPIVRTTMRRKVLSNISADKNRMAITPIIARSVSDNDTVPNIL